MTRRGFPFEVDAAACAKLAALHREDRALVALGVWLVLTGRAEPEPVVSRCPAALASRCAR